MHRKARTAVLAACLACFLGSVPAPAQSANRNSPIGTNLWFFRDWISEYSTVDAFKQSRPWTPHCMKCSPTQWDTGETALLKLDDRGWLKSLPAAGSGARFDSAGTLMMSGFGAHYPAGQYVVLYEGEGTLAYGRDAVKNAAKSSPGRDVLDVTPSGGIWLYITSTDPKGTGNYLRNIRVLMPGFEGSYASQIFHPDFLEKLKPYRALRFAQWSEVNSSTQSKWSTRARVEDARWNVPGGAGVPVETMVALANRMSADPWFTLPHQADDDYFANFAALVRDTLNPNLHAYIEFSNEVWNGSGGYNQSQWVQQQGVAKWPDPAIPPFTKQLNWHGMRTAQMCDIWKRAWGAQSNRVVCVMGTQSGNPYTASQALDCPLWTEGAPSTRHGIDAVAGGPYFAGYIGNPQFEDEVLSWVKDADGGLNKLFDEIFRGGVLTGGPAGGALQRAFQEMDGYAQVAKERGLPIVAYEGGSHFASVRGNLTVTNLFQAATLDPRMGDAYDRYLAGWRDRGGHIFMHYFNVGQTLYLGAFGALEYMDSASSPKYDSILRFVERNACWWPGCGLQNPQDRVEWLHRRRR